MYEFIATTNRFSDKHARAYKLLCNWNDLKYKFMNMLWRGYTSNTPTMQSAWAILVMMETGIRVGNEKSAEGYISINKYSEHYNKEIKTYGLTTILKQHCLVRNGKLFLNFTGKKAVKQRFIVTDESLVKAYLRFTEEKKGGDTILDLTHYDLTKFVKKYVGKNFTIKDFRTAVVNKKFIGNMPYEYKQFTKKLANETIKENFIKTAEEIGHTPTVCKTSYVSKNLVNIWRNKLMGEL